MAIQPLQPDDDDLEAPLALDDALLERAVQLYSELRLIKRPPEGAPGAERKSVRWLREEAERLGRNFDPAWVPWLRRAFLEIEGDVKESVARRRFAWHGGPRRSREPPSLSEALSCGSR